MVKRKGLGDLLRDEAARTANPESQPPTVTESSTADLSELQSTGANSLETYKVTEFILPAILPPERQELEGSQNAVQQAQHPQEQASARGEQQSTQVLESVSSDLEDFEQPRPQDASKVLQDNWRAHELTDSENTELPKYLRLVRKEARLTEAQYEALTQLARKLNRRKTSKGERITENTLIRLAVDLLLQRAEHLRGASEDELRANLPQLN